MYIKRHLSPKLHHLLGLKIGRCVIITGARQTGKTTLLKRELPSYEYFSFDEMLEREALLRRQASWWIKRGNKFIFDEVQKAPDFFGTIKSIIDNGPSDIHVVLSGSTQIRLMSKIRESLAGRAIRTELYPFTVSELAGTESTLLRLILQGGDDNSELLEWIEELSGILPSDESTLRIKEAEEHVISFGGMPPVLHLPTDEEKWLWLREYCETYLQRDLMDLGRVGDLENFLRLERLASLRTSGILNYSDLARDADISSVTAKKYINYLEISYHVFLLRAYRNRLKERLIKSSKVYFMDLGIQRVLSGLRHGLTGEQFETFVVSEIVKYTRTLFPETEYYYLRTKDGREVDLLLKTDSGYWAFEVKRAERPGPEAARHLKGLEAFLDGPLLGKFLIYSGNLIRKLAPKLFAIPTWALWY